MSKAKHELVSVRRAPRSDTLRLQAGADEGLAFASADPAHAYVSPEAHALTDPSRWASGEQGNRA
jgi:hypothetical protein